MLPFPKRTVLLRLSQINLDQLPAAVVQLRKPSHFARDDNIERVLALDLGLILAGVGNLSFRNPVDAAGIAPSNPVL